MYISPILDVDSNKASHYLQIPQAATRMSGYIEARWISKAYAGAGITKVVPFGLQVYLKEVLNRPITYDDVDEAEAILPAHGVPFNREGWMHIINAYGGFMPVRICALREGMPVPLHVPLVQIQNVVLPHKEGPSLAWLPLYLETAMLRAVWYPTTVATVAWRAREICKKWLNLTCDDPDAAIDYRVHDVGARGASSRESAMLGGMAHLVSFNGTDTVPALLGARRYYGASMAGRSIPAAEHSTVTSWGRDGEEAFAENMIKVFSKPGATFAIVCDSYDLHHMVRTILGEHLHDQIIESGGVLVIRLDSGDPQLIVVQVAKILEAAFGTTLNQKGYKVLHPSVRIIQGDEVTLTSMDGIFEALVGEGFSAENLSLWMGGGLMQKVDRDTLGFAEKGSAVQKHGFWDPMSKAPSTDMSKASRGGIQAVRKVDGVVQAVEQLSCPIEENLLLPTWEHGRLLKNWSFDEVRAAARGV